MRRNAGAIRTMNINKKTKMSVAGVGVVAAGAVLAGGVVSPISAAPVEQGANTVATKTTKTPAQLAKEARALKISKLKKKYGMYPLATSVSHAQKYRISKKTMKQIKQSNKWAKGKKARSVIRCESGGNYKINTGNGYYGAWQFDRGTWLANGGGKYARTANKAPKWAQNHIAWKTWKARGWQPWACA